MSHQLEESWSSREKKVHLEIPLTNTWEWQVCIDIESTKLKDILLQKQPQGPDTPRRSKAVSVLSRRGGNEPGRAAASAPSDGHAWSCPAQRGDAAQPGCHGLSNKRSPFSTGQYWCHWRKGQTGSEPPVLPESWLIRDVWLPWPAAITQALRVGWWSGAHRDKIMISKSC